MSLSARYTSEGATVRKAIRIALADDDSAMTDLFRKVLTKVGHEVFVAGDGDQLVELCRRVQPDLIITDLHMPQLDGLSAVQEVQRERPIPAILVTAADFTEQGVPACVRLVLRKPVRQSDLHEAVVVALRQTPEGTPKSAFPRTGPEGP